MEGSSLAGRFGLRPGPAVFLGVQLCILVVAWALLRDQTCRPSSGPPIPLSLQIAAGLQQRPPQVEVDGGTFSSAAQRSGPLYDPEKQQQQQQKEGRITVNLSEWMAVHAAAPGSTATDEGCGAGAGDEGGGAAAAGDQAPLEAAFEVTSSLAEWGAAPDRLSFREQQSRCLLHPGGRVELPQGWDDASSLPFLFDTASMPQREEVCQHCPQPGKAKAPQDKAKALLCCGTCVFENRRCETFYPGEQRSEKVAQGLVDRGFQLRAFSPCEFFSRVRGRTLWIMGDSQSWHFFYAIECFLRGFALSPRRTGALPGEANAKLVTVTWPVVVPPSCVDLVLGTRVCAVRVDTAENLRKTVLPTLHKHLPNFAQDIMIYNAGLHYPTPGADSKPTSASQLVTDLAALATWRQQYTAVLPKLIWMDVPVQHFTGPDGSYSGGEKPFRCAPLDAWARGDPTVLAGGRRNAAVAHLVPRLADAHLRTWNASVPLWDTHKPDECTHWCSPSAYHLWLYLLNDVLRDSGLGGAVQVESGLGGAVQVEARPGGQQAGQRPRGQADPP